MLHTKSDRVRFLSRRWREKHERKGMVDVLVTKGLSIVIEIIRTLSRWRCVVIMYYVTSPLRADKHLNSETAD